MKTDSKTRTFNIRNYLAVLSLMVILSIIFLRSLNYTNETTTINTIVDISIVIVSVVIVPILLVKVKAWNSFVTRIIELVPKAIKYTKENYKAIIANTAIFVGITALILAGNWLYDHKVRLTYINWDRVLVFISIALIAGILLKFRKVCYEKAHIVFVLLALIMGSLFIIMSPAGVGISWDDEIHYGRTLVINQLFDGTLYETDVYQVQSRPIMFSTKSKDVLESYENEINANYENQEIHDGELEMTVDSTGLFQIAYIPGALGIMFGRGLGLNYTSIFRLGIFFNLLFYTAIMAAGIKRLSRGKMLMSFFALTPLLIFTATTYHYDMWINSLICSGYCFYISAYQDYVNKRIVKEKDMIIAAIMIVLGCIPKAVYCPLLIPLFFIPKDFFAASRKRYYIAITASMITILLVLTAPYIINSAWLTGDQRWGGEVNSGSQIGFILHNPFQYLQILWNFTKQYADPSFFSPWANYFAYHGLGPFPGVWWSVLIVLAFIDRDEKQNRDILLRSIGLIMVIGALVLVITALYVSISEVGSSEIRGVQPRYIFPLLIPFFWYISRPKTTNVSQNKMSVICFALATFVYMGTIYQTLVLSY